MKQLQTQTYHCWLYSHHMFWLQKMSFKRLIYENWYYLLLIYLYLPLFHSSQLPHLNQEDEYHYFKAGIVCFDPCCIDLIIYSFDHIFLGNIQQHWISHKRLKRFLTWLIRCKDFWMRKKKKKKKDIHKICEWPVSEYNGVCNLGLYQLNLWFIWRLDWMPKKCKFKTTRMFWYDRCGIIIKKYMNHNTPGSKTRWLILSDPLKDGAWSFPPPPKKN